MLFRSLSQNVTMVWITGLGGPTAQYLDLSNANETVLMPWLPWTIIGGTSNTMAWQWPAPNDLSVTIPAVMQNISLGLLAGAGAGLPKLVRNTTTCHTYTLRYAYYRARLLATYGATFAVAAILLAIGYRARTVSSRSETLDFSRTLAAYPSGEHLVLEDSVIAGADGVFHRCEPGPGRSET